MVGIDTFLVFMRTDSTKVGFIFIGPNSLSRAEDLAALNHALTQAVVRVWSKIGA